MCFGGPSAPPAIPQRQAAKSPTDFVGRVTGDLRRRLGVASTILTPTALSPAATTGKTLLGA